MSVLAIIPARRGSKGIENKNFRMLAGKMLVEWTVEAAKKSEYVGKIVLSTDYHGGKILADGWGIHYHRRLPEHATDEAGLEDVIDDVLGCMTSEHNYVPEIIVLLQPTSPVRPAGLIDKCIETLRQSGADSVVTGHKTHALEWECYGVIENKPTIDSFDWYPNYNPLNRPQRQEQNDRAQESGSVFATTLEAFKETGCRCGGKVEVVIHEPMYGLEIDEPFDFWMAEQVLGDGKS